MKMFHVKHFLNVGITFIGLMYSEATIFALHQLLNRQFVSYICKMAILNSIRQGNVSVIVRLNACFYYHLLSINI